MQPGQAAPPFVFAAPEQEESSFDFWGVLNRRKWLVFLGMIVGLGLGGLYNSQCETVYMSTAKVMIQPKDPLQFKGIGSSQYDAAPNFNIRHDQLIGENNIVEPCLFSDDTNLSELKSFTGIPKGEKVQEVRKNLEVTQNREEQTIYEIKFYSSQPDDAQTILTTLIATYQNELEKQYKQSNEDLKELLERMNSDFSETVINKKKELATAQGQYQRLIVASGEIDNTAIRTREIQQMLDSEKAKIKELSAKLFEAQKAIEGGPEAAEKYVWYLENEGDIKPDPIRERSNNSEINRIEGRLDEEILRLSGLLETYGEGSNKVKQQRKIIALINERLEKAKSQGSVVQRRDPVQVVQWFVSIKLEPEIATLRKSIEIKSLNYTEFAQKAAAIQQNNLKVEQLESELAKIDARADEAKNQLIEHRSQEKQSHKQKGFFFTITQDATYGKEVWPILPVILGIGGLLGSFLGFGLGLLVELADKTFHNPDQIIKQLQVPLIGHVPVIGQGKRYLVENSLIEPIVCTYHRPKSQVSEAFRAVRTALYFNTQGKQHSVIQVTSPTPGDGKSTLASNLAVSIAQSGKRVLLVDADMRRPRQHATFGISSKVGFATVLSGQSDWQDCMFECEEIEGLTVMPCGAKPHNPAELSSSPQVKVLIEELRDEFDFVIIDTPPLLAVTDPCPIAARVDGVVLCLRIKKNVRVSAERAVELMSNLGASCIGLVVNGVGAQSGYGSQYTYGAYRAGYSYNGYGYGYGYGYGSGKYYDEDQKGRQANVTDPQPRRLEQEVAE